MSRLIPALALAAVLHAQGPVLKKRGEPTPPATRKDGLPPEEDASVAVGTKEYAFNPIQARKEISIGDQYFKKGSYRAAAIRFRRATKWNEGYAEAWLRLGEAEEKQRDAQAAKEAYAKYLELSPDAKNLSEIRKKIQSLK